MRFLHESKAAFVAYFHGDSCFWAIWAYLFLRINRTMRELTQKRPALAMLAENG